MLSWQDVGSFECRAEVTCVDSWIREKKEVRTSKSDGRGLKTGRFEEGRLILRHVSRWKDRFFLLISGCSPPPSPPPPVCSSHRPQTTPVKSEQSCENNKQSKRIPTRSRDHLVLPAHFTEKLIESPVHCWWHQTGVFVPVGLRFCLLISGRFQVVPVEPECSGWVKSNEYLSRSPKYEPVTAAAVEAVEFGWVEFLFVQLAR